LLATGATYLLFARLQAPGDDSDAEPRGLRESTIRPLFAAGFDLEKVEYGLTVVEDSPGWRSAWFWFRRST
jgi:hypothetical protein